MIRPSRSFFYTWRTSPIRADFTTLARRITRNKPIVIVKSGKTTKGAAAASSHTGALAGLDVSVDALFEQTGIIRVTTIEEMFDVANGLAKMPVPKGNRVAIVTNAGGPGNSGDRCADRRRYDAAGIFAQNR